MPTAVLMLAGGGLAGALLPVVRSTDPHGRDVAPLSRGLAAAIVMIAAVGAGAWSLVLPDQPRAWLALGVFTVVGTVLSVIDIRTLRLPDVLTLPLAPVLAGLLVFAAGDGQSPRLYEALWCAGAVGLCFAVMWFIYPAGVGMGDVKLSPSVGLMGGWFGWGALAAGLLTAFTVAAVVGLVAVWRDKRRGGTGRKVHVAFGPFLIGAALVSAVAGQAMWGWYTNVAGLA